MNEYIQKFTCQEFGEQLYCSPSGYIEVSQLGGFSLPELSIEEVGMLASATLLFLGTCWIFKKIGRAIFK